MRPLTPGIIAAWVLIGLLAFGPQVALPAIPWLPISTKATAATYVYEKDQHAIPSGVLAGLDKLNRERKIVATVFEQDTRDGAGEVPDQYRVPLAAALKSGLPSLVVTGGDKVIRTVQTPTTEAQVWEAVP